MNRHPVDALADVRAQIKALTAENETIKQRLREAICHMKAQAVELQGWDGTKGEWPDYIKLAETALQPKEGEA